MRLKDHTLQAENDEADEPQTFDGRTGKPDPTPRTPLKTLDHVRNELAKVYRAMKVGRLPAEDGTKRAYVLSTLGKVIEASLLEKRVLKLEAALAREIGRQPGTALLEAPAVEDSA
jgi:hypothetical protein